MEILHTICNSIDRCFTRLAAGNVIVGVDLKMISKSYTKTDIDTEVRVFPLPVIIREFLVTTNIKTELWASKDEEVSQRAQTYGIAQVDRNGNLLLVERIFCISFSIFHISRTLIIEC